MRNWKNKVIAAALTAAIGMSALTGCGADSSVDGTQTAVVVDGEEINLGTANFMLRYQQANVANYNAAMASMFGGEAGGILWDGEGTEEGKTYGEEFKANFLEELQNLYLLKAHAEEFDVTLTQEEKDNAAKAAKSFIESNEEKILKKIGCTAEDVTEALELYAYQEKMYDAVTLGVDTEVSDEEAKQTKITYVKVSKEGTEKDEDGKVIELTEEEKAAKKETAEKVLEKVLAAENPAEADLTKIAEEVDENLRSIITGFGDDDEKLGENLKNAALKLKDGEVCKEVIEEEDAYYVLRLDALLDREKTDEKKEKIVSDRKQELFDKTMSEWIEDSKVEAKKPWDKLEVTDKDSYEFNVDGDGTEEDTAE